MKGFFDQIENTPLWILNSHKLFLVSRFRLIRLAMGGNISNLSRSRISTDYKLFFLIAAQSTVQTGCPGLFQDRSGRSYKKYIPLITLDLVLWTRHWDPHVRHDETHLTD